jgi:hypothetical protein
MSIYSLRLLARKRMVTWKEGVFDKKFQASFPAKNSPVS